MQIQSIFSLHSNEQNFLVKKRVKLLELIEVHGSLSKAAKEVPMSYKAAWDTIDLMNNLSEYPLVVSETGGTKGGGSKLSPHAKELIKTFYMLEEKYNQFLNSINQNMCECLHVDTIQRIGMKLSARNQLCGEVIKVTDGAVNSQVEIKIKNGSILGVTVTKESVEELGLEVGKKVVALFKANAVILAKGDGLKLSARNQLKGHITHLTDGAVTSEVRLSIGEDSIVANITKESASELGLGEGDEVLAIIKASSIILGV